MLVFNYDDNSRSAVATWEAADEEEPWLHPLRDVLRAERLGASVRVGANSVKLPWWAFLAIGPDIDVFIKGYDLERGVHFDLSKKVQELVASAAANRQFYARATETPPVTSEMLAERLECAGFERTLTPEQINNACVLASLPAGATFSVPGAGKTTEALAAFAYKRDPEDRLLVVAPKNAFAAWEEQFAYCFPKSDESFVRLRKTNLIPRELRKNPKLMIIGYQQLVQVKEQIYDLVSDGNVHVFLDESHRIKGLLNVTTQTVLGLSHLAKSKIVMSGTPMPQAESDLVPQLRFLFPEIAVSAENAVEIIQPIYVRTTKKQLNLPEIIRLRKVLAMDPAQRNFYDLVRSEIVREASLALSRRDRQSLRDIGRSIIRAMQITSNPALLAKETESRNSRYLSDMLSEGVGPKVRYVVERARELASENKKVLIWTTFVENVETIAFALQDIGSVYIHGGVDAGSEDDEETREGRIKRFQEDPRTRILVANPAAASEGISLHMVCHHAIYLDRSFNAAHYLQSVDRIHRIGLEAGTETIVEIVECDNSIDEAVRIRLDKKITRMFEVLDDSSILVSPEFVEYDEQDSVSDVGGIDERDAEEVLRILRGS